MVIMASIARFAAVGSGSFSATIKARGTICEEKPPTVHAPAALAFTAAILDDRVPVAVGFCLIVSHHLEAHCLVRSTRGTAIQTEKVLAE